jgi:hypothetical protein
MNVPNPHEDDGSAFRIITATTVVGAFFLGLFIMFILVWSGIFPSMGILENKGVRHL